MKHWNLDIKGSLSFLLISFLLSATQAVNARIFVDPAVIQPDQNGIIQFSINADVPVGSAGLGGYGVTVSLSGPNIRLDDDANNITVNRPNETEVVCSTNTSLGVKTRLIINTL